MGNEVIHVYNETENHVEIVQYDRNKIFQRKFNNDPSRDPVTKIEKCSDRYPYIEIRMRHEGTSMVHEVGLYTYCDHSWIVGEGGVTRQKDGEELNVVDPDDRDVNYYRERGEENYMWKYCKQIKRYNWSTKPFLDQPSSYSSNDYQMDGNTGGISECSGKNKKVFNALVEKINCEHLGRGNDMIITAEKLENIPKIDNPKSFRLDFQHFDNDTIMKDMECFFIQYGSLTFASVHLKSSDIGSCNSEFLEQVKAGFRLSQKEYKSSQGIWVVKKSDVESEVESEKNSDKKSVKKSDKKSDKKSEKKSDKKSGNKPEAWQLLTRAKLLELKKSIRESDANKSN